jgi:NADPH:quinone reductase-like Zn-dependent oxidoreductase
MKAMLLKQIAAVEVSPLQPAEVPMPEPKAGEDLRRRP